MLYRVFIRATYFSVVYIIPNLSVNVKKYINTLIYKIVFFSMLFYRKTFP